MRTIPVLALYVSGLVVIQGVAQDTKPLTPVEAIKKVNEEVTVQMLVKAAKNRLEKRGEIYLDSEENFRDENNLGIVITKTGAAKFKEAGVNDPAIHFQDKIIQVKGTVIIKEQRPRNEVDDPKDIQIVKAPDVNDAKPKDPPKTFTNSIGMKFVWIPPGNFLMGSPKEEKERREDESQHKVTLTKGFYMGVYAVTQEQYETVMGNNPSAFKGENNLPVEQLSWEDCQVFIKKLRDKDKKAYRLPTEAEWEFACRAGTKTPFYFGETISTDQANYNGEAYFNGKKGVNREKTTPVGIFPANAWGLHDMHGNLWQWCQEWYGDYPQIDLVDPQGPEKGEKRVLRGGSWFDKPRYARSAFRFMEVPGRGGPNIGFRVCFFIEPTIKAPDVKGEQPKYK
jgi:sulfatase modifying factor 1